MAASIVTVSMLVLAPPVASAATRGSLVGAAGGSVEVTMESIGHDGNPGLVWGFYGGPEGAVNGFEDVSGPGLNIQNRPFTTTGGSAQCCQYLNLDSELTLGAVYTVSATWTDANGSFSLAPTRILARSFFVTSQLPRVVGMARTPDGHGYWKVDSWGGVTDYGNAAHLTHTNSLATNQPIVGMAATPTGDGFWLVASDGGVFGFGDASFYGSTGALTLNRPIVGMASTPDGKGYWLVASDGGIFSFGDAAFQGSLGGMNLNEPVVGLATDPMTGGYWEVAADGGIFSFNAPFLGSTGNIRLNQPIVGMTDTPSAEGYRFVAVDGGIFDFGDAQYYATGS